MFKEIMAKMQELVDAELIEMYRIEDEDDPFFDQTYHDAYYYITFEDSDDKSYKICRSIWGELEKCATRVEEGLYDVFYYYDDCAISCHWKIGAGA